MKVLFAIYLLIVLLLIGTHYRPNSKPKSAFSKKNTIIFRHHGQPSALFDQSNLIL